MQKIEKKHLKNKSWAKIFKALNNDSTEVARFIKLATKERNIEGCDLDSTLEALDKHTKSHIELTSSGVKIV